MLGLTPRKLPDSRGKNTHHCAIVLWSYTTFLLFLSSCFHATVFHDVNMAGAQQGKMKNLWEVVNHAAVEEVQEICTFQMILDYDLHHPKSLAMLANNNRYRNMAIYESHRFSAIVERFNLCPTYLVSYVISFLLPYSTPKVREAWLSLAVSFMTLQRAPNCFHPFAERLWHYL